MSLNRPYWACIGNEADKHSDRNSIPNKPKNGYADRNTPKGHGLQIWLRTLLKKTLKSIVQGPVGSSLLAFYFRFIHATSKVVHEPEIDPDYFGGGKPVIYATWHGQNFIFAFRFKKGCHPVLLVAHHGDGRMIGDAMHRLGVPLEYGSGTTKVDGPQKGGARAFLRLLRALRAGKSITMTADVPKIGREVGEGIVLLARKGGVPIVPVGMATSRRRFANSWDKMQVNKPFSKMAFVRGKPIYVPKDDTPLALYQTQLAAALDVVHERALELTSKPSN